MATLQIYGWFAQENEPNGDSFFQPVETIELQPDNTLNSAALVGTSFEGYNIKTVSLRAKDGTVYNVVLLTTGQGSTEVNYYAALDGGSLPENVIFAQGTLKNPRGAVDVDDNTGVQVCFARGTLIDTPDGPRPIEDIAVGDLVNTLDHGPQPVRWINSVRVAARGAMAPIRFQAGALGAGLPAQDLMVSPAHRMVVTGWRAEVLFGKEEVLVAARDLVNDTTIRQADDIDSVDYFHMMFDRHEIVFGNGAPSESFHPAAVALDGAAQPVLDELYALFPQLQSDVSAYGGPVRMVVSAKEARLIRG